MVKTRLRDFFAARQASDLPASAWRGLFLLWQWLALEFSSLGLALLSLALAVGPFGWELFQGYFAQPLIFLLNFLPVLLLQTLLWLLFGRQWLSFLVTALLILTASAGNFYKLSFRYEPFSFRDMSAVTAGLRVAGSYGLFVNSRIAAALLYPLLTTPLLALFARGRLSRRAGLALTLCLLVGAVPLWRRVYQDDKLYYYTGGESSDLIWEEQHYITRGFVYPFLFSIKTSRDIPPEGYRVEEAAALLADWQDATIPEARRVNLLVMQLESFTDLRALGFPGIDDRAYEIWDALTAESFSGRQIANVVGGGTIDTERCFLTGSYGLQTYHRDAPSYVRYLSSQGYITLGSHPNSASYYNRVNVNRFLGFDNYYFTNNYYEALTDGKWYCDDVLIPEVFRQFRELGEGDAPVLSFNVTLQGHGPYRNDGYDSDVRLFSLEGVAPTSDCVLNNYLAALYETQQLLAEEIDSLRAWEEPAVLLLYGDHNPYFSEAPVYAACGVSFDMATQDGFFRYYGAPYLIWANESAKAVLQSSFTGSAPTVSPGYLMNVLFHALGWEGSAFSQFTDTVMARLPVVSTHGAFVENGVFTTSPDEESRELLRRYEWAQFWLRDSMK